MAPLKSGARSGSGTPTTRQEIHITITIAPTPGIPSYLSGPTGIVVVQNTPSQTSGDAYLQQRGGTFTAGWKWRTVQGRPDLILLENTTPRYLLLNFAFREGSGGQGYTPSFSLISLWRTSKLPGSILH